MKLRFAVLMVVCLHATDSMAQYSCGSVETSNSITRGPSQLSVHASFRTSREFNICPISVQVEGWIDGIAGSAGVDHGAYNAAFSVMAPVPSYGTWVSRGKHWAIWWGFMYEWLGETHAQVTLDPPPAAGGGGYVPQTCNPEGGDGCTDPILLDPNDDGFRLTSAADGVWFDLDADGTPERIAWTHENSDDAWLAFDRNGNGTIDNGSELFGNFTPAYADKAEPTVKNGFVGLAFLETVSYGRSLLDGRIDAQDAAFARLLIWTDRNHNGYSEPIELEPLSAVGLVALETAFREPKRKKFDEHGNAFLERGVSWWLNERGKARRRPMYDVGLRRQ